jgi:hypothetical protein
MGGNVMMVTVMANGEEAVALLISGGFPDPATIGSPLDLSPESVAMGEEKFGSKQQAAVHHERVALPPFFTPSCFFGL